jgi:hypothetical protein
MYNTSLIRIVTMNLPLFNEYILINFFKKENGRRGEFKYDIFDIL